MGVSRKQASGRLTARNSLTVVGVVNRPDRGIDAVFKDRR